MNDHPSLDDEEFQTPLSDAMALLFVEVMQACNKAVDAGEKPIDVLGNLTEHVISWLVIAAKNREVPAAALMEMMQHAVNSGIERGMQADDKSGMN